MKVGLGLIHVQCRTERTIRREVNMHIGCWIKLSKRLGLKVWWHLENVSVECVNLRKPNDDVR